jgi:hypothetical protein
MKHCALCFTLLFFLALVSGRASAQGLISLGIGADVLVPTGTFGDAYSIGYGVSARGEYTFLPMVTGGVSLGYNTFSAKDVPAGYDKPKFSGVPFRVYGKYFFMPPHTPRVYGMLEMGLFFWSESVSLPAYVVPGYGTIGGGTRSDSGTNFNLAPVVGVEIPAGGNLMMDLSARYDIIFTSGNSVGNFGIRAGVQFPVGG